MHEQRKLSQAEWAKWQAVAESNDITRSNFYQRRRKHHMTSEEAASKPLMNQDEKFTDDEKAAMKLNGLSKLTVNSRLADDWTRYDAINTPVLSQEEIIRRSIAGTKQYWTEKRELMK